MKHLAAFGTITRFARDAAPFPSGRATRQPSVGTAESPHFGVFISPACLPKALSPRDGGCVFAARVEPSANQIVPILRDFTEPIEVKSTRFEPRHHQMWSLLLQPLYAGCDAGTSPLSVSRTTTADLVRSPETAYGHRPHRVRWHSAETRPNPRLLAAVEIVTKNIHDSYTQEVSTAGKMRNHYFSGHFFFSCVQTNGHCVR